MDCCSWTFRRTVKWKVQNNKNMLKVEHYHTTCIIVNVWSGHFKTLSIFSQNSQKFNYLYSRSKHVLLVKIHYIIQSHQDEILKKLKHHMFIMILSNRNISNLIKWIRRALILQDNADPVSKVSCYIIPHNFNIKIPLNN